MCWLGVNPQPASSWAITKNHCMMHGQQNVKVGFTVSEEHTTSIFAVDMKQVQKSACYVVWKGRIRGKGKRGFII